MDHQKVPPPASTRRWYHFIMVRHLILICALCAFTQMCANTTAFSVTVICMTQQNQNLADQNQKQNGTTELVYDQNEWTENDYGTTDQNETIEEEDQRVFENRFQFPFTITEQNAFFSAAALGSIISGLAITNLISRFGLRAVLCFYGLVSALCCFLIPLVIPFGFIPLFLVRMLQGSVGPAQYVMIGTISLDWAPAASTGAYLMILSSHFQLGRVWSMPTAAAFCTSSLGWPGLYVVFGILTLLLFGIFFILFRETPKEHWLVSDGELTKITGVKLVPTETTKNSEELTLFTGNKAENGVQNQKKKEPIKKPREVIPYGKILRDPVVWVVLLTYWSDEVGFEMLGQFGPIFLNRVLEIDLRHTGFWSAMPYVLAIIVKLSAGSLHRRLPCTGERTRINMFTAISQLGMSLCFILLSILPSVPKIPLLAVQIVYTAVNVFCGLDFLGIVHCSQRISQQYSHVIMAWNSIISSVTVLLLPLVVTLFAPENSIGEWSNIFRAIGSIELVMVLLFFATCDTEPRKWTKRRRNLAKKLVEMEVDTET